MNENEKFTILADLSFDKDDEEEAVESAISPWIDRIVFKRLPRAAGKGQSFSSVHNRTRLSMNRMIEPNSNSDFRGKQFSLSKFSHFMPSNCRKVEAGANNFQRYDRKNVPRTKMYAENNLNGKLKIPSAYLTTIFPKNKLADCNRRYRRYSTSKKYSVDYSLGVKLFPAQNDPNIWQMFG